MAGVGGYNRKGPDSFGVKIMENFEKWWQGIVFLTLGRPWGWGVGVGSFP